MHPISQAAKQQISKTLQASPVGTMYPKETAIALTTLQLLSTCSGLSLTACIGKVEEIRSEIIRLKLHTPPYFSKLSIQNLTAIYNGAGPDRWPLPARAAATLILRTYRATTLIHDVEFHYSDGTLQTWEQCTGRWKLNIDIQDCARWPLSKPAYYIPHSLAWFKGHAALKILEWFSYSVYKQAHARGLH